MFAIPNLTRRELLFGVPVPPDFRESPMGRHAISMFRLAIAAVVLAGICVLLLTPAERLNSVAGLLPLAIPLTAGICFYWQHRKLAPAAVQFQGPREAELTSAPDKLPGFVWLAAVPFLILAAAATWLFLNWDSLPVRFPVHYNSSGPDRWVERSTKAVYGPLFFGAELCAFFLIMALAGWFGSRRSRSRPFMLGSAIAVEFFLGFLFSIIALQPLLNTPGWMFVLLPMAFVIPLIIVGARKMSEPGEPMDPTPNECWKWGIFYYNPDDAVLFVEKREGFGYTFNFANRWSWVLIVGLVLMIASSFLILS
jgi:uncharacterized membrane protein